MVHSSHVNVSLAKEGMPTPAMLAARTWNWYFMFSFRSDTWADKAHTVPNSHILGTLIDNE